MALTSKKKIGSVAAFHALSAIVVCLWLAPLVLAVFTSLKGMDEIMRSPAMLAPPRSPTLAGFVAAWNGGLRAYMLNSFLITVPSVIGSLALSSLCAFALSFYDFRAANAILMVLVAGMLVPFQMLMIPVFRFSNDIGLYDTRIGLILFHTAFQMGFCTFFLRNFMKALPSSIFEAARLDGASDFRIYLRIAMPLSLPALAALGILEFTWIWNDYLWALILLQSDNLKPVTLGIAAMQGQWVTSYNLIAASSILAAAVPMVVFLVFQKYFIEGLTLGAEKG